MSVDDFSEYAVQLDKIWEKILNLFADYMYQKSENDGLTHVQTFLLKYLQDKESSSVTAIADYMGVTLAAVSSLVDRLVKTGLVNRVRSESDRRVVYISLTLKGRKLIEKLLKKRKERIQELLIRMGKENADHYLNTQKMLLNNLEAVVNERKLDSSSAKKQELIT